MINRKTFFYDVRIKLFGGRLGQRQVDGMNAILDEWEKRDLTDLRWLAYTLATAFWETAHTMWPIEEWGKGQGHPYGVPTRRRRTFITVAASCNSPGRATTRRWAACSASIW